MSAGRRGAVTFLFTDIEGSTARWESEPATMSAALVSHDAALRDVVQAHRGQLLKTTGDGVLAIFDEATDALEAAIAGQHSIARVDVDPPLRVRMALHTGTAEQRDGDYFGPALNRAARLMAIGHGGQILVSGVTAEVLRDGLPAGVALRDLGEHRLRDLSRPERVSDVVADGLDLEARPLRSLDVLPTNLPPQLTTFVGRDGDMATVAKLLGAHRLVTITGVGGVGKTRLALQLAAEWTARVPNGSWLCELAAAEEGSAVAEIVAAALDAPSRPDVSPTGSVVQHLRAKDLLLVLDNCEHVLDEAAELVEAVLPDCPGVRIVATSREGLGVTGEQLHPLRSLATAAPGAAIDDVRATDAVRLFVDRAALVSPDFAIHEGNAGPVAEICRRLDGIPLAIELAAARMASMSPAETAKLLDERFRLLTGGRRRVIERHQTLRATVDWSYELLSDVDRDVFNRLGPFAGGFDASAAQAVASGGVVDAFDVLDALGELVAKSMVVVEQTDGATRYGLLETLRQYALDKLVERGEADGCRRRHAQHYASFAERVGSLLMGPHELEWRPRLNAEVDNLRAAVGWAADQEQSDDVELAMRIVAGFTRESVFSRQLGIAAWAERALQSPLASGSGYLPSVMGAAAFAAFHRGDLAHADALGRSILEIEPASAQARMAIANAAASRGDVHHALAILDEAAALEDLAPEDAPEVHSVRSIYRSIAGDESGAMVAATDAIQAARALGQPSALALALFARAFTTAKSDAGAARVDLEESMRLTEAGASDVVYPIAKGVLALSSFADGDLVAAAALCRETIVLEDAHGDRPSMVGPITTAMRCFAQVGRSDAAAVVLGALFDGCFAAFAGGLVNSEHLTEREREEIAAGCPAASFESARQRGSAMSHDALVAFLLAELTDLEDALR